jgi:hypothetical protein
MVHLPTLNAMRKHYESNLEQMVKEHPGEYVLYEGRPENVRATYYSSKKEMEDATNKYKDNYGATFLVEKIPSKTHRF